MTDPNPEAAPTTETTSDTPTTETSRRGRPRPDTTIERDKQVLDIVAKSNGVTRSQIANELEIDGNTAYLSLYRLRKDGKIDKTRSGTDHVWVVVDTAVA